MKSKRQPFVTLEVPPADRRPVPPNGEPIGPRGTREYRELGELPWLRDLVEQEPPIRR